MKSSCGQERPSDLIDKIEIGWHSGKTISLTTGQCRQLWIWIEEMEDEVNHRRMYPALTVPFKSMHDDPDDYIDEDGYWLEQEKTP